MNRSFAGLRDEEKVSREMMRRGSAPSDHDARIQGGFAPLISPTRDLRPLTRKNLASEATGLDASLGIERILGIVDGRMITNTTLSNESASSDAR